MFFILSLEDPSQKIAKHEESKTVKGTITVKARRSPPIIISTAMGPQNI